MKRFLQALSLGCVLAATYLFDNGMTPYWVFAMLLALWSLGMAIALLIEDRGRK